ncbi:MAG: hypothetical protein ACE15D_03190 [Candidatus Eisenbacteria bacterium]
MDTSTAGTLIRIQVFEQGIRIEPAGLWCDPWETRSLAYVSHAHGDHARAGHGLTLASAATADLMIARGADGPFVRLDLAAPRACGDPPEQLELLDGRDPSRPRARGSPSAAPPPFPAGLRRGDGEGDGGGGAWRLEDAGLEVFSAGHVLGSTSLRVTFPEGRLALSGDFKLRASLTCDPVTIPACDLLVMESTYGLPIFRFPPEEEVRGRIVETARESIARGEVPVFLGYGVGRGPEIVAILERAGIPAAVHRSMIPILEVYARHGHRFSLARPLRARALGGRAVVIPIGARESRIIRDLPRRRIAYVSGWAVLDPMRRMVEADVSIPMSDHAGFDDLLAYVEASGARRVLVTHGYAEEFAETLRARGCRAQALRPGDRIEIPAR